MDTELYNKYIVCIHKCGSLTKAAKQLGVSQPALSTGLSNMERKLGFKIFNRKTIPLTLTQEGNIYLEYLLKQEILLKDYQQKITDICDMKSSKVVIGGPVAYVETVIAETVTKFHLLYPECKVQIKNAPVPELIDMANSGEIDCFISTSDDLPSDFSKVPIQQEKIYLCIPFDWEINKELQKYETKLGSKGDLFDYSILSDSEFIFLEENQPLQKEMEKFFIDNNISPQNYITVNQVSAGVALTAFGVAISFASEEALLASGHLDKISIYSLPDNISGRTIYIAYPEKRYLSYASQELMKLLPRKNF